MGGSSNGARDARMRQLIEEHISKASTERTVPVIVEPPAQAAAPAEDAARAVPTPSPVAAGARADEATKANARQEPDAKAAAQPAKAAVTSKPRRPARPPSSKEKSATLGGADAASAAASPRHIEVGQSAQPH
jgi:D-alanyl-D-alanine carboxypeptidase